MRAIETVWKGYRFRSRLEARWAVFFDALGINWEYEPEGFELSDGTRYLPDFRVSSGYGPNYWYEIKPKGTKSDAKFCQFKKDLGKIGDGEELDPRKHLDDAMLLAGDPFDCIYGEPGLSVCPRCGLIDEMDNNFWGHEAAFACYPCDFTTPCGGDNPEEPGLIVPVTPYKGSLIVRERYLRAYAEALSSAIMAARSARFEHGEAPVW
jgi:hypothetical protein